MTWLVTRYDGAAHIGTDRRFSRNFTADARRGGVFGDGDFNTVPGGIFNLDPPGHTNVRRIIQRFFSPAAAKALRPTITAHAHRLLDAVQAGPNPTDLVDAYTVPLALHMAADLMHIPVRQRHKIVPDVRTQTTWGGESELIGASTQRLLDFTDELIDAQRHIVDAEPEPANPVTALIAAEQRDEITNQQLRGTIMYLLLTSAEPVTGPTAVGVYTLLRHPHVLADVRRDDTDERWAEAVTELLRYHHNGALSMPRRALVDVDIGGVRIRAGESVLTPWLAAANDPHHFTAPGKFRLGRAPTEHPDITFGHGPHYCLGSAIARTHLTVALRTLWERLPDLTLAVKHEDIAWEPPEFAFTRPVELPVTW